MENNLEGTLLMVKAVLYATAGTRRAVVALDAATGELLWTHSENEAQRGAYEVDDVEALRMRLASAGYRNSTVPNNHPHRKRVYFYDRDGNDWESIQYLSSDPAKRNDYRL